MFRCGIDYTRCKWIMPLLLLFAVIFDIIAIAAKSGWLENDDGPTHYASMWEQCRADDEKTECWSLMDESWAKAVAALMIIGLIILIIAFILSLVAMCNPSTGFFIGIGVLLFIVAFLQIIALIIYPVNFPIFEGHYYYTWAYGFGWGATIICLGCSFIFCCLTRYIDRINGDEKIQYIYQSK